LSDSTFCARQPGPGVEKMYHARLSVDWSRGPDGLWDSWSRVMSVIDLQIHSIRKFRTAESWALITTSTKKRPTTAQAPDRRVTAGVMPQTRSWRNIRSQGCGRLRLATWAITHILCTYA
jgi:hypothetical protein